VKFEAISVYVYGNQHYMPHPLFLSDFRSHGLIRAN